MSIHRASTRALDGSARRGRLSPGAFVGWIFATKGNTLPYRGRHENSFFEYADNDVLIDSSQY